MEAKESWLGSTDIMREQVQSLEVSLIEAKRDIVDLKEAQSTEEFRHERSQRRCLSHVHRYTRTC